MLFYHRISVHLKSLFFHRKIFGLAGTMSKKSKRNVLYMEIPMQVFKGLYFSLQYSVPANCIAANITGSPNHRTAGVGSNLKRSLSITNCS